TNNANLRRCAPTAWPDERGIGGRMLVDWVAGWRGMRTGEPISQRELVRKLSADGYPVSQSHISKMQDTVRCLLPVIPSALYSGLGKPQIERLLSLRKAAGQTWLTHTEGKEHIPDFEGLFQDVLSLFDGDASEFVYERVQDELISHMQSGTGLSYEQLLLTLSENQNQARRSSVIDTPVSLTPAQQPRPEGLPPEGDDPGSDQQQEPGIQAPPPEPGKNKGKQDVSPKSSKNEADKPPPQAPELTEEERAARLVGHIVSPISTTERVQDVKRQLAALDGENLPDFKTNALISIPVQAGGLHPISDVWYIERILDQPDELRPVIAQLAREIAHLSGINPDSVIDVPGGLGFLCQDPPEDVDLSDLANNVLTLLQSISGVYAIALIKESPEQPLDVSEFQFTAALAQLLLGSPRYEDREAILQGRLDDTCLVKLFRLIRLGRRLVELEMGSVSVVQTP
ncbi:ParB family protein, partial [Pseudomonas syringae]